MEADVKLEILKQKESGVPVLSLSKKYQISPQRIYQICNQTRMRLDNDESLDISPGRPQEGKFRTTISFDPDVWELIKDIEERSRFVNQQLRIQLRKKNRSKNNADINSTN